MSDDLHIPILNVFLDDEHEVMPPGCVNHPDRPSRTNLDGDELCQDCADAWVRGEGDAAFERELAPATNSAAEQPLTSLASTSAASSPNSSNPSEGNG